MFDANGDIVVIDMALSRMSIFQPNGVLISSVPRIPSNIRQVVGTGASSFLLLGAVPKANYIHLATLVERDGQVKWQGVPAEPILQATNLVVDGVWGALTRGGTAVLGLSISPTIVRVDLKDGHEVCRSNIPRQYWVQLDPRLRPAGGGLGPTRDWIDRASHVQSAHSLSNGDLLLSTERTAPNGEVQNEWHIFDTRLAATKRIRNVPGRLLRVFNDTAWITGATEDGRAIIRRVQLFPSLAKP
ncbi:MAG: hypothetical protein IPP90_00640 [Gemmatimonadaceae bacterium]|nr:hypothetical protein [Gemmatimonadaceae bacterium]